MNRIPVLLAPPSHSEKLNLLTLYPESSTWGEAQLLLQDFIKRTTKGKKKNKTGGGRGVGKGAVGGRGVEEEKKERRGEGGEIKRRKEGKERKERKYPPHLLTDGNMGYRLGSPPQQGLMAFIPVAQS